MTTKDKANEIMRRLGLITKPLEWDVMIGHPGATGLWQIHFFPKLDFYPGVKPRSWSGMDNMTIDEIVGSALRTFLA